MHTGSGKVSVWVEIGPHSIHASTPFLYLHPNAVSSIAFAMEVLIE
jgi:hypothetical protein